MPQQCDIYIRTALPCGHQFLQKKDTKKFFALVKKTWPSIVSQF